MSTQQPSQGLSQRSDTELTHQPVQQAQSQQATKWGEIGISAVAAAAQQASEKRAAELKAAGAANRVVTLRDIDYFAS